MNVILIDDEEIVVNTLKKRVAWEKYGINEVYTAFSMEQAQKFFRENAIDMMLSDIEMPQGNGLELFEWVKVYYPAVECVYITCHAEFDYVRKAIQLGTADYILKPIDYQDLDEVISRLVERVKHRYTDKSVPSRVAQIMVQMDEDRSNNGIVVAAKQYICEHIRDKLYIAEIAEKVKTKEQHLMRTFKKVTGISVVEFITNERVKMAKDLLISTDYSIRQVADSVGYRDLSYFTRNFKRVTGMTPQTFRKTHGRPDKKRIKK